MVPVIIIIIYQHCYLTPAPGRAPQNQEIFHCYLTLEKLSKMRKYHVLVLHFPPRILDAVEGYEWGCLATGKYNICWQSGCPFSDNTLEALECQASDHVSRNSICNQYSQSRCLLKWIKLTPVAPSISNIISSMFVCINTNASKNRIYNLFKNICLTTLIKQQYLKCTQ